MIVELILEELFIINQEDLEANQQNWLMRNKSNGPLNKLWIDLNPSNEI